jgi:hypothetical protein
MDKSELSAIRARLRAEAETESRRPRRPLLGPLRGLMGAAAPLAPAKPALPPPRRVGLNPTYIIEDQPELVLVAPIETSGRNAFGQRTEPVPLLQLPAPDPIAEPPIEAPRWGSMLAQTIRPAAAVSETPFHPEDFSDPPESDTERLYAAAGLPKLDPNARISRLRLMRETAPAAPPAVVVLSPEQELLAHLERMLMVEFAGLEAMRIG